MLKLKKEGVNMAKLTKVRVKKYLDTIKKSNKKYVDCKYISNTLGIQEYIVREELATFDDLIRLLDDFNLVEITPLLSKYINNRTPREKPSIKYDSIGDFVYKNMTSSGGLVNRYTTLNKEQLMDLNILVKKELKKVKK